MRLDDFDNLHAGKRAFAIGNGPSLSHMDLSPLAREITFAANRFYQFTDRFGFQPTYLCVSDPDVYRSFERDWTDLNCIRFIPHVGRACRPVPPDERCFALPYVWGPGNWITVKNFRRTMDGVFHSGNTVMIDFITQLAFCMGISELYLIGCDCTKQNGRHFFDESTTETPILRRDIVMQSYRVCRTVYESDDRKLINAGVGGQLHELPRVRFDSLFERVAV